MANKLTKREKKATDFRNKKKNQSFFEDKAVPEADPPTEGNKPTPTLGTPVIVPGSKTASKNNAKRSAPLDDTTKQSSPKKSKIASSHGNRFIVFVGNLAYDTTKEDLDAHFGSSEHGVTSIRLMTDKVTNKPKGFAFVEFKTSDDLRRALALHHSRLKQRKINVELTAGGGGKAQGRQEKLKLKNEKLTKERERRAQRMKEGQATPAE